MWREKKLILILDLDHTLVNSTRLEYASPEEEYLVRQADLVQDDPNRSLFKLEYKHMVTKLRPFVRTFLQEASSIFELYIYTMAKRSYALEIAKLLDPENLYFDSKVISQEDCTQRGQKGLDVVLGDESIIVILDDTEFVWQGHRENLILIERYHYFASSCMLVGTKTLSGKEDERESDGPLAYILSVLKRAHQLYFDQESDGTDLSSRDVRQILKKIKGEVLQGCRIVFSRVFAPTSVPEDVLIWKMAKELGATCASEVDSSVTHVVASSALSWKAGWAMRNQKFLVNPQWIKVTHHLSRRQREEDFPLNCCRM